MDPMSYAITETLGRLPNLLDQLCNAPQLEIRNLTRSKVVAALPSGAGVYLFCQRTDGAPVYVGRSANLPQRVGTNHRSTQQNQAALTNALMLRFDLDSMGRAREYLYEHYTVRLLAESDVPTRALLEIYAAMELNTEFNSFLEH